MVTIFSALSSSSEVRIRFSRSVCTASFFSGAATTVFFVADFLAGAIFLGNYSPTVLGDYVAGPSHVLPTDGAGASFAGLTVDQFQRRTSVVEYNRTALKKALKSVKKFAELEGLAAHGRSAEVRLD